MISSLLNKQLVHKGEAIQVEQMKLSWVQHQENIALQEKLEKDRQAALSRLAELNYLDCLVSEYNQMYQSLDQVAGTIPELMMNFAIALSNLEDKSYAKQQGEDSVNAWLRLHEIENYSRKILLSVVTKEDEPYFRNLQKFIENIGDSNGSILIRRLLEDWLLLNELGVVPDAPQVTVDDIPQEEVEPESDLAGEEFSFEVVTVNTSGNIVSRETRTNRQQSFDLEDGVTLEMVYIPKGNFIMGEQGNGDAQRPQNEVGLESFWMAKYPITQAQYRAIIGNNPSYFQGDNQPVERVSWYDAVEFCRKLSSKTGKNYQLPSELQWEYACLAGRRTQYCFGDNESQLKNYAWYDKNSNKQTHPVGQKKPNPWGLYDMHGNVWEWCADHWHENALTDDSDWLSGDNYCSRLRGGSWLNNYAFCRSAYPINYYLASFDNDVGFRVVCESEKTL